MLLGFLSPGLWELRQGIELLTGGRMKRITQFANNCDAIVGWGHKPTAIKARKIARKQGVPYIAFEDGFLRSVEPGNKEPPLSLIMDRTGIYYDARQPSDLEALIRRRASTDLSTHNIRNGIALLQGNHLSKYNNSNEKDVSILDLKSSGRSDRVLVVDQTIGDESIVGALADRDTFSKMLEAAISENPGAEIIVRVHPETVLGRKAGHFCGAHIAKMAQKDIKVKKAVEAGLVRVTPEPISAWALLGACEKIYCVSSQLGFEGLLAGCEVHCFGASFYNGWGLTCDRSEIVIERRKKVSLEAMFAAVYYDYCRYGHVEQQAELSFPEAVQVLLKKRDMFVERH